MNAAKVQFSEEELQLVQNASWVLTKNKIIRKVYDAFGNLAEKIKSNVQDEHFPPELLAASAKIARGENYHGLPYVMLDFPRYFTKQDIFAVRTFFWWGNYFSVTLHLKGKYQQLFVPALFGNRDLLAKHDFFFDEGEDEWQHDLLPGSMLTMEPMAIEQWLNRPFIRCVVRINFEKWNEAVNEPMEKVVEALLQSLRR